MSGHPRQVYFARCIGPTGEPIGAIKVGCSYGFSDRLAAIGRNQPFKLEAIASVPGHLVLEKACHLYLRRHRIDGEYFHENEAVMSFINRAKEAGGAFYYFTDSGFDHLPEKSVEAFMGYHGVSIEDVCEFLSVPVKRHKGKLDGKHNVAIVAATAILAQSEGRFVHWPGDALRGLCGELHPLIPRLTGISRHDLRPDVFGPTPAPKKGREVA